MKIATTRREEVRFLSGSDRPEEKDKHGIEISKDGKWFYMAGWGSQTFIRFSRG